MSKVIFSATETTTLTLECGHDRGYFKGVDSPEIGDDVDCALCQMETEAYEKGWKACGADVIKQMKKL